MEIATNYWIGNVESCALEKPEKTYILSWKTSKGMKRAAHKPLKQGRYWCKTPEDGEQKLVFVEQQSLGLYVLGKGWLSWQTGEWSDQVGENEQQQITE